MLYSTEELIFCCRLERQCCPLRPAERVVQTTSSSERNIKEIQMEIWKPQKKSEMWPVAIMMSIWNMDLQFIWDPVGESPATGGKKKPGTASSGDVLLWRWFGLTAWIYNQVGFALKGELRNNLDFLHKEICFVWVKCGGEISSLNLNSDFLIWILTIGLKNH